MADEKEILTGMGINENRADEISKNEKYEQYKKDGLKTWNQKLKKGQGILIPHENGEKNKYRQAYINGFWKNQQLQDEDTYEEGKDNHWHNWRGINIVDHEGKPLGNINAYQIYSLYEEPTRVLTPSDVSARLHFANEETYEPTNQFQRLSTRPENASNNGWYYEGERDEGYVHDDGSQSFSDLGMNVRYKEPDY